MNVICIFNIFKTNIEKSLVLESRTCTALSGVFFRELHKEKSQGNSELADGPRYAYLPQIKCPGAILDQYKVQETI